MFLDNLLDSKGIETKFSFLLGKQIGLFLDFSRGFLLRASRRGRLKLWVGQQYYLRQIQLFICLLPVENQLISPGQSFIDPLDNDIQMGWVVYKVEVVASNGEHMA